MDNKTKPKRKLMIQNSFTFIDLFAGIGGFHQASKEQNGVCVFACEIEPNARFVYQQNHKISKDSFAKDLTKVDPKNIPRHDLLLAGFPCQPFSQSGFKKGFKDTRGNLFFSIAEVIKIKKPKAFLLENVRHLINHDCGRTFQIILATLEKLGYKVSYKVVKATDFGLPQHRPRVFIVGIRNDVKKNFVFPDPIPLQMTMSDVFNANCTREIGFTLRVGGKNSKLTDRRNWDGYMVNNEVRRIGPSEGLKMMGFPKSFEFNVSNSVAMKLLGNSVAVPAVSHTIEQIIKTIN